MAIKLNHYFCDILTLMYSIDYETIFTDGIAFSVARHGLLSRFGLKQLVELTEEDYSHFETEVTKRGYQFFKVYNKKIEDGISIKLYHYIRSQGDDLEYVNYKVKTKFSFPKFKEISVSYCTSVVEKFNVLKNQIKLNKFELSETNDGENGNVVASYYESDEFAVSIATVTARNKANLVTYEVAVSEKPLLHVGSFP